MSDGVLPDHELRAAVDEGWIRAPAGIEDQQFQPASLDLRLGAEAYQLRASFLPFRETVQTSWHMIGTCKMGVDDASVVDPELRVRGVANLRVVDTSICPTIPSSNTNAAAIAIGEKGADLVLAAARAR